MLALLALQLLACAAAGQGRLRGGDTGEELLLTADMCGRGDHHHSAQAARATLDAATARLVRGDAGSPFAGFVDGVVVLTADNETGVVIGGG